MYKDTFPKEIEKIKVFPTKELFKHADVSLHNKHYCKECFCCACLDEVAKRYPSLSMFTSKIKN